MKKKIYIYSYSPRFLFHWSPIEHLSPLSPRAWLPSRSLLESSPPVSALLGAAAWKALFDTYPRRLPASQQGLCLQHLPCTWNWVSMRGSHPGRGQGTIVPCAGADPGKALRENPAGAGFGMVLQVLSCSWFLGSLQKPGIFQEYSRNPGFTWEKWP